MTTRLTFSAALAAALLPLYACGVETIEVGSRVDEARESGRLPAKADLPLPKPEDGLEGVLTHLLKAGQRNATPDAIDAALRPLDLPAPLHKDLVEFLTTVDLTRVKPDALPLHAVGFLAEKHHVLDHAGTMTEDELVRIGLALSLDDATLIGEVLESAPGSRLLHCHHADHPDTLITAYATAVVSSLKAQNYTCVPVRVRR